MKIHIDTDNFLPSNRVRCIAWVLLYIAVGVLIFSFGVSVGSRHFRHHMQSMRGRQFEQSFNAQQYYGDPSMDAQYGEAAGYSGDGAMTDEQIQQSGRHVIYFNSQ